MADESIVSLPAGKRHLLMFGLLAIAIFIHTFDALIRLPGGRIDFYIWTVFFVLYAVLAVIAQSWLHTWKGPVIASGLAAFVIPFLYSIVASNSIAIGMLMLLMPTWVLYLLIFRGEFPILGTLYIIFWIVFLAFSFMPQVQTYAEGQGYELPTISPGIMIRYTANALYRGFWNAYEGIFIKAPEIVAKEVQRSIAVATGDYYTGKVDASAEKKLGVYLDPLKPAQAAFYEKEAITVFTNLRAETIDRPIKISLSCKACCPEKTAQSILPQPQFTVETFEQESVDCVFRDLSAGRYTATLTADFEFTTRAYQKVYFMDQERLRDYNRRAQDPLEGFPDKAPATQYSPGPVMIGMGLAQQPVGIIMNGPGPTIGVTIDNLWAGELKEIKDLTIYTPKGLKIEDINGVPPEEVTDCAYLTAEEAETCNLDVENIYRLPAGEVAKLKGMILYSVRLHTKIDDYSKLIGNTPISVKNIKVSSVYDYKYSSTVGFNVLAERVPRVV